MKDQQHQNQEAQISNNVQQQQLHQQNGIQQEYTQHKQQTMILLKKIEHPPQLYTVQEVYSIKKQSSNIANDIIYKKLTKSFHRIKKLRSQHNGVSILTKQYDYDSNSLRQSFKKIHEIYNTATKTNLIVKKRIDKMRNKVDRIKNQVQQSQLFLISEIDLNKIYANRNTPGPTQPNSSNSTTPSQQKQYQNSPHPQQTQPK